MKCRPLTCTIVLYRIVFLGLIVFTVIGITIFGKDNILQDDPGPSPETSVHEETCELEEIKTELNIPDMYEKIKFPALNVNQSRTEDPHQVKNTSLVKNISKGETRWTKEKKLKVFVLLHSHNDPGWGETLKRYYNTRSNFILNNIVEHLTEDPELKFIWSETCIFDMWWREQVTETRDQVKMLVEEGQLEFVGGGWVMPDEASTHYYSLVTQLIEGHQWLQQHLNYTPSNGWAIDPFGLSSTSAFFHQRSGMKNTVFSRFHYLLREQLKNEKKIEFYWRQPWDRRGNTDLFCYPMPYGSYAGRNSCGPEANENPNSQVCLEFVIPEDDRHLGTKPETNLAEKRNILRRAAEHLLDQYRKKSLLYNTNNVLVPIGDDFTWKFDYEWTRDIKNLKHIFNYINSNDTFNTEIKFATLSDYFDSVHKDMREKQFQVGTSQEWKAPVFSGDFFTYADRGQEYWSGYYTSRPFHKASERQLMTLVRSSQLIFTLMAAEISKTVEHLKFPFINFLLQKIVESRRTLSLFQHHDAITGTSDATVVTDFSKRMFYAMHHSHFVIQQCIHIIQLTLQHSNKEKLPSYKMTFDAIKNDHVFYEPVINKSVPEALWEDNFYRPSKRSPVKVIAVFNPLAKVRKQLVKVGVKSASVKVVDSNGKELESEIFPVFDYFDQYPRKGSKENEEPVSSIEVLQADFIFNDIHQKNDPIVEPQEYFELFFLAEFRPLEIKYFKILYVGPSDSKKEVNSTKVRVRIFNAQAEFAEKFGQTFNFPDLANGSKTTVPFTTSKNQDIQISNHYLNLKFNENGTTTSATVGGVSYPLKITYHAYTTNQSGLYLFMPLGPANPLATWDIDPVIIVVEGRLRSYVEVWHPTIRQRLTLINHDGLESYEIHVDNIVDIRRKNNYELIMRITTGIKSGKEFFTDSNGFQMMRREHRDNLPIQANYYPVASSAFIQDSDLRLTVLTAQPGGLASLTSGQLEIMLDRIVHQDDGKGIGQGGTDNTETVLSFKLILEKPSERCEPPFFDSKQNYTSRNKPLPLLSLEANIQQLNFLHPLLAYKKISKVNGNRIKNKDNTADYALKTTRTLPCDIHLLGAVPLAEFTDTTKLNNLSIFMKALGQSALLFHRMGFDARFSTNSNKFREQCTTKYSADKASTSTSLNPFPFGQCNVKEIFGDLFKREMMQTSLSLTRKEKYVDGFTTIRLKRMEIYPFVVDYKFFDYDGNSTKIRTVSVHFDPLSIET